MAPRSKNGSKTASRILSGDTAGGFTKFYGEDWELGDNQAFNNQPAGRRALTIAAGPVFNIAFALLLVVIVLCAFGDYAPVVGEVWEDSPAQEPAFSRET